MLSKCFSSILIIVVFFFFLFFFVLSFLGFFVIPTGNQVNVVSRKNDVKMLTRLCMFSGMFCFDSISMCLLSFMTLSLEFYKLFHYFYAVYV